MELFESQCAFHIDDCANKLMMTHGIPQLDLVVTKNGDTYSRRFCSHLVRPCTDHCSDTYMLSSITKTFTAYLIVNNADALGISLSDPIVDHLPVLAKCSNIDRAVRIIDLLGHTAGINPVRFNWTAFNAQSEGTGVLEAFKNGEYCFSINSDKQGDWSYTSVAYDILGALIESRSGSTFSEYLSANIIRPLEMNGVFFDATRIPAGRLCQPTVFVNGEVLKVQGIPNAVRHRPSAVLFSSADTLSKWGRYIASRGSFSSAPSSNEDFFDLMWSPRISTRIPYCPYYGLGWFIGDWAGKMVVGHGGRESGFNTLLIAYPHSGVSITILMNTHTANVIWLAAEVSRCLSRAGLLVA